VAAASRQSIKLSVTIEDHDLMIFHHYGFHAAGSNFSDFQRWSKIILHGKPPMVVSVVNEILSSINKINHFQEIIYQGKDNWSVKCKLTNAKW